MNSGYAVIKNTKGFTLIELLVVVAIIGILAAVGVPMYQGYQATAKFNAVKATHKQAVTFVSSEVTKCGMGKTMDLRDEKGNEVSTSLLCGSIEDRRNASGFVDLFVNHFNGEQWKNPMLVDENQAKPAPTLDFVPGENDAGYIYISGISNKIFIRTAAIDPDEDPADALVQLKNVIRVE